jgi:diguanylate cyclase (GGDEF)-like protein
MRLTATDGSERIYQVHTTSLQNTNHTNGLLIVFTDITEIKMLQAKLEHQAYYDELTQIYNRRAFFQHCKQSFAEAKKISSAYTIVLIDIDYFKKVNDTYGHHVGDQLLVHVARICQTQLKEGQFFARYGGEEFVLALNGYTESEGEVIANKLRRNIETNLLTTIEGDISVTISCGLAEATKETEETLYQLLNKADKALYLAKQEGRNRVCVYTKHGDGSRVLLHG